MKIKLYLDEDVNTKLAIALQQTGYDVITVENANRKGYSDESQLNYASKNERIILTHHTNNSFINIT